MTHDAPTADPSVLRERRVLVVVGGGGVFARDLPARGRLVVGRALECDVRIDDPAISRTHVVIVVDDTDGSLSLAVESRTGRTRLDGRDVTARATVPLEPGQLIDIGSSRLVVRRVREALTGLSVAARPMDATRRAISLAGKSELPALVLGETGAGKEVAMESIVAASRRKSRPLVRIHCAAIPEAMLEGELFGQEGANPGLFEAASGGTAFLDEIGDLPLALQPRLLRIIESREVTRLGSAKPVPVDVRIIAATHADVRARVAEGTFREDLYFRLAGIVVEVPPLRERQDEIAEIARSIAKAEAAREKVAAPVLSEGALALLVAYRWPGNVRELRNVVVRAMHVAGARPIEAEHLELLPPSRAAQSTAPAPSIASEAAASSPPPVVEVVATTPGTPEHERARIVAALDRASGNQKEAARILGMTRRMLMYRLDAYSLPRPRKR